MRSGRRGGRRSGGSRSEAYWFHPKKRTGWHKDQSPAERRRRLLASTPKSKPRHGRYLTAYRRANALANVTKDSGARRAARSDAEYFRKKVDQ